MEATIKQILVVPITKNLLEDTEIHECIVFLYSETSIHCFCRGSEKETMDPGKQ
jgi:hypothetical protein